MRNKLLLPELHTEGYSVDELLNASIDGLEYLRDQVLDSELAAFKQYPEQWRRNKCEQLQDTISHLSGLIASIQSVYPEIKILENVSKFQKEFYKPSDNQYTLTIVYNLENSNPEYKIIPFLVKGIKIPLQ